MGFTVYYRSTNPVPEPMRAALDASAGELCRGRTWLSCEPVCFQPAGDDGHMQGACKPNFMPHPKEVAAAEAEDLPDGTIADAVEILCRLSRRHKVDWEISHDYVSGPIGFIRDGVAEPQLLDQIEGIGGVGDLLAEFERGESGGDAGGHAADDADDDGGPHILPFRPPP